MKTTSAYRDNFPTGEFLAQNVSLRRYIGDAYEQWANFSCKPSVKKLKSTHIEDLDKSVRWNMAFVEKNNLSTGYWG